MNFEVFFIKYIIGKKMRLNSKKKKGKMPVPTTCLDWISWLSPASSLSEHHLVVGKLAEPKVVCNK